MTWDVLRPNIHTVVLAITDDAGTCTVVELSNVEASRAGFALLNAAGARAPIGEDDIASLGEPLGAR